MGLFDRLRGAEGAKLLKRADLPSVQLRAEVVAVETLGGNVLVRGRGLPDTLRLAQLRATVGEPKEGEGEEDAQVRAGAEYASHVLAIQVLDADEKPLMSASQWSDWGGVNYNEFTRLYEVAERLSGGRAEHVEKN